MLITGLVEVVSGKVATGRPFRVYWRKVASCSFSRTIWMWGEAVVCRYEWVAYNGALH